MLIFKNYLYQSGTSQVLGNGGAEERGKVPRLPVRHQAWPGFGRASSPTTWLSWCCRLCWPGWCSFVFVVFWGYAGPYCLNYPILVKPFPDLSFPYLEPWGDMWWYVSPWQKKKRSNTPKCHFLLKVKLMGGLC